MKLTMAKAGSKKNNIHFQEHRLINELQVLSRQISNYSNRGLTRVEFLKKILEMLIELTNCDEIELWILDWDKQNNSEIIRQTKKSFFFEIRSVILDKSDMIISYLDDDSDYDRLCKNVINGHFDPDCPFFTENGTFWIGNLENYISPGEKHKKQFNDYMCKMNKNIKSFIMVPLLNNKERIGLFQLKDRKINFFNKDEIELYENFAQTLGISLLNQKAQAALRERVKELTCMYRIAQASRAGVSINEIMQSTVDLLPQAWQYPHIAHGRIKLNERIYTTRDFCNGPYRQRADIIVKNENRGYVEVVYTENKINIDEGPFLKEERNLIDNIAKALSIIIDQKQAEEDKIRLEQQIRHADRLATIGQLSAGIAHELNEPLGNILGFAQLLTKNETLQNQVKQDIERIINASLHAREIVKKLLIFARQMPTKKTKVCLNQIVNDGLYFLESRFTKEGVTLNLLFEKKLPEIIADPAQITQVLVNLVVNAIQAMPQGGVLNVQTISQDNHVVLIIEDSGIGICTKDMKQIFLPFFTTKGVGQGTGLGLAVVHGIVTSHGGMIEVDSHVGKGTRFMIKLPVVKSD